jgi:predicted aspartyl protease
MTKTFDAARGLVIIGVEIWGPAGSGAAKFAVDTGASRTLINNTFLEALGYEPRRSVDRTHITTGSGIELVANVNVTRLEALGKTLRNFYVLGHTLPATAAVDGLLGLDFLRRHRLTLDFRRSTITLT